MRPRQFLAAAVHRVMTIVLLRAARMVWVATPAWEARWRPYAFGRDLPFRWLPEPASVPIAPHAAGQARSIRKKLVPAEGCVVGAFSTSSLFAREMLAASVPMAIERSPASVLLLVGNGSVQTRDLLIARFPALRERIHATGPLEAHEISAHLSACDLAVQPYPDGICTRHSSAMTVLAHGVPMVTTEGRFTEDLWRDSGAVSLVSPGEGARMASATEELLTDPHRREARRRRALDLYDARFNVRHTASALLAPAAGGI
jgi:glycosyltransferase involved in cell wall biosynthesis